MKKIDSKSTPTSPGLIFSDPRKIQFSSLGWLGQVGQVGNNMGEIDVREVKIKNCEGIDRIPLRILNEGAEILHKPLSTLFKLIYVKNCS